MIRQECAEIGEKLINSREILQEALDMTARAKSPYDLVSSGLAKDMINQAIMLERDVELPKEEGMRLEVDLAGALEKIKGANYDAAISDILRARRTLLHLIFQTVVECEFKRK